MPAITIALGLAPLLTRLLNRVLLNTRRSHPDTRSRRLGPRRRSGGHSTRLPTSIGNSNPSCTRHTEFRSTKTATFRGRYQRCVHAPTDTPCSQLHSRRPHLPLRRMTQTRNMKQVVDIIELH